MNVIERTRRFGIVVLSIVLGFQAAWADPNATWQVEPSMAVARDQFTGGVIGDYLYVFGGNGNPDGVNLKSTEAFHIDSGVWSFGAANEHNGGQGVEELTAAVVNDRLYVFGAWGGTAPDGYYGVFNFNERYNPVSNTWTTLAQKPTTSAAGPAAVYDGEIYLFGGYFDSGNPSQDHEDYRVVECYDPASNTWRSVTNLPSTISSHAVGVVGSKAYVIGGYSESAGSLLSDVVSFDFDTEQWETEGYAPLPVPLAFSYSSAAPVLYGRIYLVGGIAGDPTSSWAVDSVYIFDPAANTWYEGPALPQGRENQLTVLHDGRMYVVGGYVDPDDENRALDDVLSLDVSALVTPVYRFWSPQNSRHFYTISLGEKDYVQTTYATNIWGYETKAYYAFPENTVAGLAAVYRFWSNALGAHFYTISEAERDYVVDNLPAWTYEGPVFYAYPEGSQPLDASPVYRFWSESLSTHFYTINEAERDYVIDNLPSWEYETIAWYAYD